MGWFRAGCWGERVNWGLHGDWCGGQGNCRSWLMRQGLWSVFWCLILMDSALRCFHGFFQEKEILVQGLFRGLNLSFLVVGFLRF